MPFGEGQGQGLRPEAPEGEIVGEPRRPRARPTDLDVTATTAPARAPAASARTVEQFDTTTSQERQAAAAAPAPSTEKSLGDTVASLGDPTKPGFWLETPLVSTPTSGRVFFPTSGLSAQVELIPIDGPSTAGSRISLAAMRLIEAPLTDLPTIQVFSSQ